MNRKKKILVLTLTRQNCSSAETKRVEMEGFPVPRLNILEHFVSVTVGMVVGNAFSSLQRANQSLQQNLHMCTCKSDRDTRTSDGPK